MRGRTGERETIPLEAFLAELPEPEAEAARTAAREIEALEHAVGGPGWIERNLMSLGLGSLILFTAGIVLLILRAGGLVHPGLGLVILLLAAFPALVLGYLWSVRGRTRLDREKMDLNERHFLPHGGAYFGAPDGHRRVMRVAPRREDAPTLKDRTERLHAEVTRRRWWW